MELDKDAVVRMARAVVVEMNHRAEKLSQMKQEYELTIAKKDTDILELRNITREFQSQIEEKDGINKAMEEKYQSMLDDMTSRLADIEVQLSVVSAQKVELAAQLSTLKNDTTEELRRN